MNFSRYIALLLSLAASVLLIHASHCVDDAISIERAATLASRASSWYQFMAQCGWAMSKEKRQAPSDRFNVTGIEHDLSPLPHGNPRARIAGQRIQSLASVIRAVLQNGRPPQANWASHSARHSAVLGGACCVPLLPGRIQERGTRRET